MDIVDSLTLSVVGGLILLFITESFSKWLLPTIQGRIQKVPKLNKTTWEGYSPKFKEKGPDRRLEIYQTGTKVKANIIRRTKNGERKFEYSGRISGGQIVLTWEEPEGAGFIIGAMVLHLSHDMNTLAGTSTYFSHKYGKVISTDRVFNRL